jgi:outer membrane protein insertion porin family
MNFQRFLPYCLFCCLLCGGLTTVQAQLLAPEPMEADTSLPSPFAGLEDREPQQYEIKSLSVRGFQLADSASIANVSGLYVGKEITLPGEDLSRAIRQIWKQNLFIDVSIDIMQRIGDEVSLEIVVKEYPRLASSGFKGVPKAQHDDLRKETNRYLVKGRVANQAMRQNVTTIIKAFYEEKGFPNTTVNIVEQEDEIYGKGYVKWALDIKRGGRMRISDVVFEGNEKIKSSRLRRVMKETRRARWYTFYKSSKFIEDEYRKDKRKVEGYYNTQGMRDAKIVSDSVIVVTNAKGKKSLQLKLKVEEGNVYYFGDINFRGNTSYQSIELMTRLGIKKGDVYNGELLNSRISYDPNGRDISTLYMDNGYLFFRADPIEKGIKNDSVQIEVRIAEGPVATVDKVIIKGNDRTHEHVIRRELRTLPGGRFSRSDIIRSQRELMALNYFNPETMNINTPVNPQRGTVDIEYTVEERPSDQLELSAGWGGVGRGVIGTLGVTFNNFSLRNVLKPETWSPLPQGDGQRLSLRAQSNGRFFQSYNFSFTEPWLGGKRPMALSVSGYHNRFNNGRPNESSDFSQLLITGVTVGIGTRLRVPDDWFILQTSIDYQNLGLTRRFEFTIPTGTFHNLALNINLSRNSIDNPTFPQHGASISLGAKLTLPYSLLVKRDYTNMTDEQKYKLVEYHKFDFKTEWYTPLAKNLVFKASAKMGFLGSYNKELGLTPFERYELGGDGISNFVGLQGKTIISMRGYKDPTNDVSQANQFGAAIYNKYTAEVRYLISPNPSATFYVLAFAQAGNAWSSFRDYNPFQLKRSAGIGLRAFLPMFGTLGFDYGFGFDKNLNSNKIWDYGSFNIVLGFEPE